MNIASTLKSTGVAVAAALAHTVFAGTYTWLSSPADAKWNTTSLNWSDGTTSGVAWVNYNDAAFANTAALTVNPIGDISAGNITKTGSANLLLTETTGTGLLSWTGWFSCGANVYFRTPLGDDGNGLHFDVVGGIARLQRHNSHTGGTFLRNSSSAANYRAFVINGVQSGTGDGSDLALGPVPDTVRTNIVIEGGNVVLHNDGEITIHKNRTILIRADQTFFVSPNENSILHIKGDIVAENHGTTKYPTWSRICSLGNWKGRTVLYGTNYVGKLLVTGNMEIREGQTRVIVAAEGTGTNAAFYAQGNGSAYSTTYGYLLVSGGRLWNSQAGHNFQTGNYGHLDIAGGTVQMTYSSSGDGEFLNGYGSPGKITIRDGGFLLCGKLRLSETTAGDGGEVFLEEGGTFSVRRIGLNFADKRKGTVHFNGGAIQSLQGNAGTNVVEDATNANWDGCNFVVEAGGAVFDTSNGQNIWFGRPLVSGVAAGETDGGVVCKLGSGRTVFFNEVANHSYTGPTRIEAIGDGNGARTLDCRIANALPAATTLQVGPGTTAKFNNFAQAVGRVEGKGRVEGGARLSVTGAVAPVFNGAYGVLTFKEPCGLTGDLVISGDASGCGCLKFEQAGQDVSGLALTVDTSALDDEASGDFYKIIDAPNGYTGMIDARGVADPWQVKYTPTAAYLVCRKPFVMVVR